MDFSVGSVEAIFGWGAATGIDGRGVLVIGGAFAGVFGFAEVGCSGIVVFVALLLLGGLGMLVVKAKRCSGKI